MAKKRKMKKYCPGNFRQPTPDAAKKFLAKWAKAGVKSADDVKVGVGNLKTDRDVKLVKIRMKQAEGILNFFNKKVEAYEANKVQWADCKQKGIKLADCFPQGVRLTPPSGKSTATKGCAGNFRTPSKKNAKNYLKRFFRQFRTDITKFAPDANGVFKMMESTKKIGPRGSAANFVPKIQEAIEVIGVAEAAEIAMTEIANSIGRANVKLDELAEKLAKSEERATKSEQKLAKQVEDAKKRLTAKKDKLAADKAKLKQYLSSVSKRKARRLRRK